MLITRLELENFKSYIQAEIRFVPGTNAIIGPNGAGKSSLLEAIGFALFNYRGTTLAHCIREGSESGTIIVRFISSLDEREYEVERQFTTKATTRYRVYDPGLDNQVIADGAEETQTWLRQHMRVEDSTNLEALFENTIGVPQGTLTAPFQQPASARKAIFDPLLRVEEYRKAAEQLLSTASYLKDQINDVHQAMAHLEGRLAGLPGLQAERQALEKDTAALERQGAVLQRDLERTSETLATLDEVEQRVRQVATQLERLQAQLAGQGRLLAEAQRELEEAQAALLLVTETQAGHQAYLQAELALAELEPKRSARDRLRTQCGQVETEYAALAARLDQLSTELAEIAISSRRLVELKPLVEQQQAQEIELRQAEDDTQRLLVARGQEKALKKELRQAEEVVAKAEKGLEQATALEETSQQAQQALEALLAAEQAARQDEMAARAESAQLREQFATLSQIDSARCPVCEAELTPEHQEELLANNTQRATLLKSRTDALAERVAGYAEQTADRRRTLVLYQKRLRSLPTEQQVQEYREALEHRRAAWQEAAAEVARHQGAPQRAQEAQEALASLGNPRREYERHEDRVSRQAAREEEQRREQAQQQALQRQMAALQEHLLIYAELDAEIRAAQAERERYREAHHTYLAHIKAAEQREPRQQRVARLAEESRLLQERQTEVSRQHEQVTADYDARQHARARQEASRLQQELAGNKAQLGARRSRLADVQQDIARLLKMEEELGQKRAQSQEMENIQKIVGMVRELLKQAGPQITKQLVRQISHEASSLYGDIMADHSDRLAWSEDYELSLDVRGRQRAFRQFSGGEQMSAALALRLALLKGTSAIDVAFFDEPTAHLDSERRESLVEQIVQVKGFAQLFVISHDDTFERAVQHYIRIVKDKNGSSCNQE